MDAGFFALDELPQQSFIVDEALADLAEFRKSGILVMK